MPSESPCTLREDPKTGRKGVHSQEAAPDNKYNQNFRNQFCGCEEQYNPHQEKGTMFQCLGLGNVETGGCGEDWWHPECLIGLPRDWHKKSETEQKQNPIGSGDVAIDEEDEETPLPPGFPAEDDFWQLICFKCIDSNPWLKRYAGTQGFLPPVFKKGGMRKESAAEDSAPQLPNEHTVNPKKRKAEDDEPSPEEQTIKRTKEEEAPKKEPQSSNLATIDETSSTKSFQEPNDSITPPSKPKHTFLPASFPSESFSLFLQPDFHDHICRCPECYPYIAPYPQLREEEDTYEPPLSDDGEANGAASTGTGSLLERGEAALSNVDRVRAIEGAMVYNHLRDKVKEFLKPFAESGQAVSAEDIKGYFERLRGDEDGIKDAAGQAQANGKGEGDDGGTEGDGRREQNGQCGTSSLDDMISISNLASRLLRACLDSKYYFNNDTRLGVVYLFFLFLKQVRI